jgi:endonuclease/exonuclease/phosphatase family metal-dependent hydrolase
MPTFRVMTYNILFGGVGREGLLRGVVDALRPDVAVFTEVTSAASLDVIAGGVGVHRAAAASRSGRDHPVIVSRWPILQSDLLGPPWAREKWVAATIRPCGGPPIEICGVHLVPQPLWPLELLRRAEIRSLVRQLRPRADRPHLIAGDFNALAPADGFRRDTAPAWVRAQFALQRGWPRWALTEMAAAGYIDCYRTCNERDPGYTVSAWNPGARIDYVFASGRAAPSLRAAGTVESSTPDPAKAPPRRSLSQLLGWKTVTSLGGMPSDHLPVWADFEWPSA